jgi:hypothetical protein
MSAWDDFARECAEWPAGGATLWWRDDDAVADTPALARLFSIAEDIPLALAVVPADLEASLAPALDIPSTTVLQHGYAHTNHAPGHEKKMELGPHRPFPHTLGDIAQGWARLEAAFGARARTILVPPWNRIAPALVPFLPEIGFKGLSTFGPRRRTEPVRGLVQANCHADLIDWRGGRAFAGEERVLGALIRHLSARRTHLAPAEEPTGLLTHHLVHDDAAWQFLARLVQECRRQRAITWLAADEVFRPVARRP